MTDSDPVQGSSWRERRMDILTRGLHSDCILHVRDPAAVDESGCKEYRVHALILATASPIFDRLLQSNLETQSIKHAHEIVADGKTVMLFLEFVYTGRVSLDQCSVAEMVQLVRFSHTYMVQDLVGICERALIPGRCFEACEPLNVAVECSLLELRSKCIDTIINDAEVFFKLNSFANLTPEALRFILQQDLLNISSELVVCNAVICWAKARLAQEPILVEPCCAIPAPLRHNDESYYCRCKIRKLLHKYDILRHIRFLSLSPQQIVEKKRVARLLTSEEINAIIVSSVDHQSPPPAYLSQSKLSRKMTKNAGYLVASQTFIFEHSNCYEVTANVEITEHFYVVSNTPLMLLNVFLPRRIKWRNNDSPTYREEFRIEVCKRIGAEWTTFATKEFIGECSYGEEKLICDLECQVGDADSLLAHRDQFMISLRFQQSGHYLTGFRYEDSKSENYFISPLYSPLFTQYTSWMIHGFTLEHQIYDTSGE